MKQTVQQNQNQNKYKERAIVRIIINASCALTSTTD